MAQELYAGHTVTSHALGGLAGSNIEWRGTSRLPLLMRRFGELCEYRITTIITSKILNAYGISLSDLCSLCKMLNVGLITIIVSNMRSHCVGTAQMTED